MSDDLNEKRAKARLAMEGPKHKAAREAKEKALKDEALKKEKLAADLERERAAARAAEVAKKEAAAAAETKAWHERQTRLSQIQSAKQTVEIITKNETVNLTPIRTFKTDLAEIAKSGDVSVEKIIIKEKERGRRAVAPPRRPLLAAINWRVVAIIVAAAVVLAAIAGAVYIVWPSGTTTVQPLAVPSLITPNEKREINLTDLSPEKIAAVLANQHQLVPVPSDSISQLYFVTGTGPTRQLINFPTLANLSGMDLPLAFTQALGNNFMLGLYQGQTPAAFYLFTTDQPDALRAAMLGNEQKIIEELFNPLAGLGVNAMVETAKVRDAILNNTDVRIFTNLRGQTVFVYGLIADNLLVITENETAFSKIFDAYRP